MVGRPNNIGATEEMVDVLVPWNLFRVGGPNNVGATEKMSINSLLLKKSMFRDIKRGDEEANINDDDH